MQLHDHGNISCIQIEFFHTKIQHLSIANHTYIIFSHQNSTMRIAHTFWNQKVRGDLSSQNRWKVWGSISLFKLSTAKCCILAVELSELNRCTQLGLILVTVQNIISRAKSDEKRHHTFWNSNLEIEIQKVWANLMVEFWCEKLYLYVWFATERCCKCGEMIKSR